MDRKILLSSLTSSPRGSSPGPGGCTCEHLKVLLEDSNTFDLLIEALNSLAQAAVPRVIADVLMSARLTAFAKKDGGVRGIATGKNLRRVVGRTLAKQYMKEILRMSVLRSSMHSPPEPAQIAWGTCFGRQQTWTPARLS